MPQDTLRNWRFGNKCVSAFRKLEAQRNMCSPAFQAAMLDHGLRQPDMQELHGWKYSNYVGLLIGFGYI